MADSGPGPGPGPADSYIGSLISLTSKSEIRFEGFLYAVDTENSNIVLQNVRSFGTEGRKKDGPQIPASDKVYEYITFRGTDIKDLHVKLSPPQIHNDPAIISVQAQATQPASIPPPYVPPVTSLTGDSSSSSHSGVSSFPSARPLYDSSSSGLPLWGPPPAPVAPNGTGLAMPVFWQGFYKFPDDHRHLEHQHFKLQPPPAQFPSLPVLQAPSALGQYPVQSSLAPIFSQPAPSYSSAQPLEGSSATSIVTPVTTILSASPILSDLEIPVSVSAASSVVTADFLNTHPSKLLRKRSEEDLSEPHPLVNSARLSEVSSALSVPGLPIAAMAPQAVQQVPKAALASGKGPMANRQAYKQGQKTTDPSKARFRPVIPGLQQSSAQPLLPLPVSPNQQQPLIQGNDSTFKSIFIRRGRGRGNGIGRTGRGARSKSKFLEDFDFMAMNEKFKKEEVWGELLKEETKDKVEENGSLECLVDGGIESEEFDKPFDKPLSDMPKRSVYVKDDFFDLLSCDALNQGSKSERTKFSEQRKIDTETFGSFPLRSRGGHRGWFGGRGGRGRGRNISRGRRNAYRQLGRSEGRTEPVD